MGEVGEIYEFKRKTNTYFQTIKKELSCVFFKWMVVCIKSSC